MKKPQWYIRSRNIFSALETAHKTRIFLDTGQVETSRPRVHLNGKDLDVLWHPPFRVEITDALKPGSNDLAIAVTTTWHSRQLINGSRRQSSVSDDEEWIRKCPPLQMGS